VRTRPSATASHADPARPFFGARPAHTSNFFTASLFSIAAQARKEAVEDEMAEGEPPLIHTKLTMGVPGDRFEEEADATADRVVQRMHVGAMRPMAAPSVQAKCADCLEEERLQRQAEDDAPDELLQAKADGSMDVPGSVQRALEGGTGGGATMHPALRNEMESAFEADFTIAQLGPAVGDQAIGTRNRHLGDSSAPIVMCRPDNVCTQPIPEGALRRTYRAFGGCNCSNWRR
jgi:hypothetical protein